MKPDSPLVSVIIPTYNRASLIVETLDSVWHQTWRPIELIIVDDGSTDATRDVIARWIATHQGPKFATRLIEQAHQGAQIARNHGIAEATGAYLQFLDSDDTLDADKLTIQVAAIESKARTLVFGEWYRGAGGPDQRSGAVHDRRHGDFVQCWLRGSFVPIHALLWPRSAVAEIGAWDERLTVGQDGDYLLRAVLAGWRLSFVEGGRCFYRPAMAENVSAGYRRCDFESRLLTIEKVRAELHAQGELERYSGELVRCLERLALSAATRDAEFAASVLKRLQDFQPGYRAGLSAAGLLLKTDHIVSMLLGHQRARAVLDYCRDSVKRLVGF